MAEWRVVIQETHSYEVRVDAEDYVSAMRAAREAREQGEGRRTSKKPYVGMPVVSRVRD